jgi:hypothetical protein
MYPERQVTLFGRGRTTIVECVFPASFGLVPPGLTAVRVIDVKNFGIAPITLTQMMGSGDFRVADGGTELTLPEGNSEPSSFIGDVQIPIAFTPQALGTRAGTFTALTSNPKQPMISCALTGNGGGPDIDVSPVVLDFGNDGGVATVRIQNVADPMDPLAKLTVAPHSVVADAPDAGGTCSPMLFTTVLMPGAFVDVPIWVTPPGRWKVAFASNDFDEPVVIVDVRAGVP